MHLVFTVMSSLIALLSLSGCTESSPSPQATSPTVAISQKEDTQSSSSNYIRSYRYTDVGCETGLQEFSSFESFCAGLMNEQLNLGCAKEQREQTFRLECANNKQQAAVITGSKPFAAHCKTRAEDFSDRFSLLRTHENQNLIAWDGQSHRGIRLVGPVIKKFGMGYLSLSPTRQEESASAKLVFKNEEHGTQTRLVTAAKDEFTLAVSDHLIKKSLSSQCFMSAATSLPDEDFSSFTCDHYLGESGDDFRRMQSKVISLSARESKQESLQQSDMGQILVSVDKNSKFVTVVIKDFQGHRQISARGTLSSGLELLHTDEPSGQMAHIKCYAAQK